MKPTSSASYDTLLCKLQTLQLKICSTPQETQNIKQKIKRLKNKIRIFTKNEKIAIDLNKMLNDLNLLNAKLIELKREPRVSKTQALAKLKTIPINIYDLLKKDCYEYEKDSFEELRVELFTKKRRFPLDIAKRHPELRAFLITLYRK